MRSGKDSSTECPYFCQSKCLILSSLYYIKIQTAARILAEERRAFAEQDEDVGDDFLVVDKEDAVEALAYYLAQCITKHPEAQALPPKQLQQAVSMALQVLCTYTAAA